MNDNQRTEGEDFLGPDSAALEEALGTLFRVGRLWAQHGLRVAEIALHTSAETLRATADALNESAQRFGDER